ncbi:MAG: hypothetical protein M1813_002793 [Trichoglossum hirsutum]|nr:MAG: hypothetical protein M1813_002793 [Trichoglossum hirsutum]
MSFTKETAVPSNGIEENLVKETVVPGNGIDKINHSDTIYLSYAVFLYNKENSSNGFRGDLVEENDKKICIDRNTRRVFIEAFTKVTLGKWIRLIVLPEYSYDESELDCDEKIYTDQWLVMEIEITGINTKQVQARWFSVLERMITLEEGNGNVRPMLGNIAIVNYCMLNREDNVEWMIDDSRKSISAFLRLMCLDQKVKIQLETDYVIDVKIIAIQKTDDATDQAPSAAELGNDTWEKAHAAALKDSFWDEIALHLQNYIIFLSEKSEITGSELRDDFRTVLARLKRMPFNGSFILNRFSAEQRLVIVCIGYDINTIEIDPPVDLWSKWDDDELDELAGLLSNSSVNVRSEKIDKALVATWLNRLETLFAS